MYIEHKILRRTNNSLYSYLMQRHIGLQELITLIGREKHLVSVECQSSNEDVTVKTLNSALFRFLKKEIEEGRGDFRSTMMHLLIRQSFSKDRGNIYKTILNTNLNFGGEVDFK